MAFLRGLAAGAGIALITLAMAVGCGGGDDTPPPIARDAGPSDADGPNGDGGGPGDAETNDGGDGDGGPGSDGGLDAMTCRHDAARDRFELGTDAMARLRRVAVAGGDDRAFVAWAASMGGERLFAHTIGRSGMPTAPMEIAGGSSLVRGPAVAPMANGRFALAWYGNETGNFEIHGQVFGPGLTPVAPATRLSSNMVSDDDPAVIGLGAQALVAWRRSDGSDVALRSRVLGAGGTAQGSVTSVTTAGERVPSTPKLGALGDRAVLAWTETTPERHAWVQPLDSGGQPQGQPEVVDTEGNVAGNVDVATTFSGGAAAFDVTISGARPATRFRPLSTGGLPDGSERNIAPSSEETARVAIAPFINGFVAAYHRLSGDGAPALRVALLEEDAEIVDQVDLGETSGSLGPIDIAVTKQRTIVVGWAERGTSETILHAARLRCGGAPPPPMDGGVDGGPGDGGGFPPDAIVFQDASATDGGPGDDGGGTPDVCPNEAGVLDPCACEVDNPCTSGSCPDGRVCLEDSCGRSRCQPASHRCETEADCAELSTCSDAGRCEPTNAVECNDSRDCPFGYACEGGSCVNRRIRCELGDETCPVGFFCFDAPSAGVFCARSYRPCETETACFDGQQCLDVDGDGAKQCIFGGSCTSNSQCDVAGRVCGHDTQRAECLPQGPCTSETDCGSGHDCRDLWGDGLEECVPEGGECTSTAECSSPQLCASVAPGLEPRCSGSGG